MLALSVSGCAGRPMLVDFTAASREPITIRAQDFELPNMGAPPQVSQGYLGYPTDYGVPRQTLPAVPNQNAAPKPKPICLRDAIVMALSHSEVIRTLGKIELVTGYDPAIADLQTRSEMAAFAPGLRLAVDGGNINAPPNSYFGPGLTQATR